MSSKDKYNTFFFVRLGILLLILVLFAGGIFYDRQVLIPAGMEAIDKIANVDFKDEVQKAAGKSPKKTQTVGSFDVETFEFGRILPFLKGPEVSVIYRGERVIEVITAPLTEADLARLKQ